MRFFSNENRDSDQNRESDDQDSTVQTRAEDPADPTPTVPQQRTGSPWSAAPGDTEPADSDTADAELAAQERADGSDEPGYAGDHRPDAVDLPLDDHDHDHTSDDLNGSAPVATAAVDEENKVDEGETVEPTSSTTTYGPDGTVTDASPDATDSDIVENEAIVETDVDDTGDAPAAVTSDGTEPALQDDGDFDDPTAVDPATDEPLDRAASTDAGVDADSDSDSDSDADSVPDDAELAADANTEDDDAVAAADDTGTTPLADAPDETWNETRDVSLDETPAATSSAATVDDGATTADGAAVDDPSAPVVPIPVPVGDAGSTAATPAAATAAPSGDKLPGSVAEPDLSSIFNPDDATSFHDRWRDVQLKFVDSPKDATTEAAGLLDEAVEKLAASLRDQKAKLHQVDSDDTEQLRVELRGYRDILNRVLGL